MSEDIFKDDPGQGDDFKNTNSQREDNLRDTIKNLKDKLNQAERELSRIAPLSSKEASDLEGEIHYGSFDGENMVTEEGKVFAVPPNYASKSKMVEGDELKLTITPDGGFIFKQIHPVDRKRMIGVLSQQTNGDYVVKIGSKPYKVLLASVTYYRAKLGDEVAVIIPSEGNSMYAAFDSVVSGNKKDNNIKNFSKNNSNNKVKNNYNDDDSTLKDSKYGKKQAEVGNRFSDERLGNLEQHENAKASILDESLDFEVEEDLI